MQVQTTRKRARNRAEALIKAPWWEELREEPPRAGSVTINVEYTTCVEAYVSLRILRKLFTGASIMALSTLGKLVVCLLFVSSTAVAQYGQTHSIVLGVDVTTEPRPTIRLSWPADERADQYQIWKTERGQVFGAVAATLPKDAREWTDTSVVVGKAYDYRVGKQCRTQAGQPYVGFGYTMAGIGAIPSERRRVLMIVDTTMGPLLANELATYEADLRAEGFVVTRRSAARTEAFSGEAVETVRDLIKEEHQNGGRDLTHIVLIGRIAVPYSGNIAPDAHVPDHKGAWPADGIYGDIDGEYTDFFATFENTQRPNQDQKPGDGKYDQDLWASDVEIAVGRIDFFDLPGSGKSELELLKQYFVKNHAYRTGEIQVDRSVIVDDNFSSFPEGFSISAWSSLSSFGGSQSISSGKLFTNALEQPAKLFLYGCGPGSFTSAGGIGSSADFVDKPVYGIFSYLFGSYFGDWDTRDNFMRMAVAASPSILTCGWSGRPHWFSHPMAMGETIGYVALKAQNNSATISEYPPSLQIEQGTLIPYVGFARYIHIALMGDPTLRASQGQTGKIGSLTGSYVYPNKVQLQWTAANNADGYIVYRRRGANPRATLLTPVPVTELTYMDSTVFNGEQTYTVVPVRLQTFASGTFYDVGERSSINVVTTDVEEETPALSLRVNVSPNPATSVINVEYVSDGSKTRLDVVTMTGSVIVSTVAADNATIGTQRQTFSVHDWAPGRYIVRVTNGRETATALLTVQR